MRIWLLLISLVAAELGDSGAVAVRADDEPTVTSPIVVEPKEGDEPTVVRLNPATDGGTGPLQIGEFALIDLNGDEFRSTELNGHPWVAAFIFTRCAGYCPTLVRNLRLEVADRVDDPNLRFVVISVDPDNDTPERLKQYAEIFVSDFDRWRFLTGDKSEIFKLVRHGFRLMVDEAPEEDRIPGFEVAHSLSLIHVGPDGRVIGKYDSRDEQQVLSLRRVLNGVIETPEENRAVAAIAQDGSGGEAAATTKPPVRRKEDDSQENALDDLPSWAARLPSTNAMLNGLATLLLLGGFVAVKRGNISLHKRLMLFAFATSIAFLGCYLAYHFALNHYTGTHGKPFAGTGVARTAYYGILITHVVLAMAVPVLAIITIYHGLKEQWASHRRIAKATFPIWLYVSVTGVIIYGMLYHWPT